MNKSINKTFTYLLEELKDIPATGKNEHFTNIRNLLSILKSGYIKGNTYPISSDKFRVGKRDKVDHAEICTTRPSSTKQKESIHSLSANIDGIKITLFTDRILTSIPTMRKAKIAEFVKPYAEDAARVRAQIKKEFNITLPQSIDKKYIFESDADEGFHKYVMYKLKDFLPVNASVSDYPKLETLFMEWLEAKELELNNLDSGKTREAEERLVYDKAKTQGIPVDPRYMRITFVSVPTSFYPFNMAFIDEGEIDLVKEKLNNCNSFLKAVAANKELFEDTSALRETIQTIKKLKKENEDILKKALDKKTK